MSSPASRYTDGYLCTQHMIHSEIARPDPPEVFIGGQIAAKLSDFCTCGLGHISPIAEGASEVLVRGMPAARIGVKSLDGGVVIWGEPTVLIGSSTFALPSCITIVGDPGFQSKVLQDMVLIASTKSGKLLLAQIADAGAKGRKVTICQTSGRSHTDTDPRLEKERQLPGGGVTYNDPRSTDGTGTDAKIYYNPAAGDATLFHETVHANDITHGTADEHVCDNPGGDTLTKTCLCGERKAVGLPPYDDPNKYPFSENKYREERGYLPAKHY